MIKPNLQQQLFKYNFTESGCSLHQAGILFKEGLLSFSPKEKEECEGFEIEELNFLKHLYFDSGIPINVVKSMLCKLEKPYSYSFDEIYWDYGSQEWKELPPDTDSYINDNLKDIIFENFAEFLESIDEEDTENLSDIKVAIDARLDEIVHVIGTDQKRTELDDILDKIVLDKDHETHHVKRTRKQNTEILAKSYLKVKK